MRSRYFALPRLVADAMAPLTSLKIAGEWDVTAHVSGGGIHAQAGAVRLGVARALVEKNEEWKKASPGFRVHDPRFPHGGTQKVRPQKSPQVSPVG